MRVAVTGASGLIGTRLSDALRARGDEVVPVSLRSGPPAPGDLAGCDAVVHLAGEPVAQRWTTAARERIRSASIAAKPMVSPATVAAPCSLACSATAAATAGATSRLKTDGTM